MSGRWWLAIGALLLTLAALPFETLRAQDDAFPSVERVVGTAEATVRVVVLHPWGGSARSFLRSIGPERLGCRARFVSLEGPYPEPPGHAWFTHLARSPDQRELAGEMRSAADRLARFLGRSEARHQKTVVAGYSQGAMLALALGALHPERADAVVVAAGTLPRALWPDTPPADTRFTILHGRDDAFVPFAQTEALAGRLGATFLPLRTGHRFRGALGRAFRRALRDTLAAEGACPER